MDSRLAALRRLIEGLAPQLELDLAIRLWDGETIPLGSRWSGDLALAIHDPSDITRLLRRPRLPTLIGLLAEGKLDIEGGTLLDIAARRGERGTKGLAKKLNKLAALRAGFRAGQREHLPDRHDAARTRRIRPAAAH